jgi:hypothetical protein
MMLNQHSVITIMKDGQIVNVARVNFYALPFIEAAFIPLTEGKELKFTVDESIQYFLFKLLQSQKVQFLPAEDNYCGSFLYLIHFKENEVHFSIQHPKESVDDLSFVKLLTWANEPAALIPTNIN